MLSEAVSRDICLIQGAVVAMLALVEQKLLIVPLVSVQDHLLRALKLTILHMAFENVRLAAVVDSLVFTKSSSL